ncbi:MAG TPA: choice-of-anchor R domain-containing protein [Caulobacteraceae bacterium]|jgi:hypothetical protein
MNLKSFAVLAALGLATSGGAQAYDLYNNLGAATSGTDPVASFGPLADSFSTQGFSVSVENLQFLLDGNAGSGGFFMLSLLADNNGAPGSVLATSAPISDASLNTTLTPFGATCFCDLSANTRYWLQVSDAGGTSANWAWSLDTSGPGVAGEFFANQNGVFPNSGGPYQMEVSVAVPEPAAWALMLVGFGGLGGALRFGRRNVVAA